MMEFVRAERDHGTAVLANLRDQERRTIEKLNIDAPSLLEKALENGFPSFTLMIDGEPAAMFGGASTTMLGTVRLWMLTTPLILQHQVPLLRASREYVRWMHAQYGPVIGMVDSEFEKSKRWLKWIGFKEIQQGEYIVMRYSNGD